jgi:hypothetical protein
LTTSRSRSIAAIGSDWSAQWGWQINLVCAPLGDVSPDKGTIAIEKNATIGFLPQETAAAGDETVLELALAVSPSLCTRRK